MARQLTLDYDDMGDALNALIAACVYSAFMSALLFGVLVLLASRRQQQLTVPFGICIVRFI